tara:strand:- start:268 stop:849 length:582 start_codon:yes stop_codon:yes gene_type:complete
MPVNYQQTKIYKIWSPNTEQVYIGATTVTLAQRMGKHRQLTNNCASKIIIDLGDAKIELIEEFPCNNKMESDKKEGEYIRKIDCVNKVIIGRTNKEWYIDNKEKKTEQTKIYRENNKEKISEKTKAYRLANLEKVREQEREQYKAKNKEKLSEQRKAYRIENLEKIRLRDRERGKAKREKAKLKKNEIISLEN